jgi:hypothetical protein
LQVVSTAQRLHTIADHLRQDQLAQGAANLVDRGAESVEDIGHYLESATVDSLASKAESFGRGRPLTFVTTAFALGVAGSRILKAAAARLQRFGSPRRAGRFEDERMSNDDVRGQEWIADTGSKPSGADTIADAASRRVAPTAYVRSESAILRSIVATNPLGAAGAIGAGFLVGLAFPVSNIERDKVGLLGETLQASAKATASEVLERGKTAVADAVAEAFGASRQSKR